MKRTRKIFAALVCAGVLALAGCGESTEAPEASGGASAAASSVGTVNDSTNGSSEIASDPLSELWSNAKYREDTEIGSGAHFAVITVRIGGRKAAITVRSDKDNLAEMLTESGLAEGDTSEYGLYIKRVNGVLADYDTDKAFWSLQQNGTPTAVGASSITISDGDGYELVYTLADADDTAA